MIDYNSLQQHLTDAGMAEWAEQLPAVLAPIFSPERHGQFGEWLRELQSLPQIHTDSLELCKAVRVGLPGECPAETLSQIEASLRKFHPWRKGPYQLFDLDIDTEWRSDWKWDRVIEHIAPLDGRVVLDVGCGNGYHGWRMLGEGARFVLGIDPLLLNVVQFLAMQHFVGKHWPINVLPIGIEAVPEKLHAFDTVFSMGVLYHRRSPIDHLQELMGALRPGGELVLETLVIDGGINDVFLPPGRYAKMRNVWFIPSCIALEGWLKRCGFQNVRTVDLNVTSLKEQRTTDWMNFHSLPDFLDPENPAKTAEGHPAPKRAVVIANAP